MLPYIKLTDSFILFSYPFIIGFSWAIAYRFSDKLLTQNKANFKNYRLFFWGNFILSWFGAKVFYLITANNLDPKVLVINSNFWLGGGFVFYGGLIFGLLYTGLFLYFTKQSLAKLSPIIPVIPLAHGIGRVGCLLAGCCYGHQTNFFLSIFMHNTHRHPVQIYEALFLFGLSWMLFKKKSIWLYLISYSVFRFFIEFLRGDEIRGQVGLISSSQFTSLILLVLVSSYLFFKSQKPSPQ